MNGPGPKPDYQWDRKSPHPEVLGPPANLGGLRSIDISKIIAS